MIPLAKRPVVITNRGKPAYVLLAYKDYCHLRKKRSLYDAFSGGIKAADIELDLVRDKSLTGLREVDL